MIILKVRKMKRLKSYLDKSWSGLLSSLLAVLGFSGCGGSADSPEDIPLMYGTPTASFSIKGKVQNSAGHALPGVRVVIPKVEFYQVATESFIPDYPIITEERRDTLYTDEEGRFGRRFYDFPTDTVRYELQFYDVNPLAGVPACEPDTLKVTFTRDELQRDKNDNEWNRGNVVKEITVTLKEKAE